MEWFTSARTVNAREALEAGFIERISPAPALEAHARALAESLTEDLPAFRVEKSMRALSPRLSPAQREKMEKRLRALYKSGLHRISSCA